MSRRWWIGLKTGLVVSACLLLALACSRLAALGEQWLETGEPPVRSDLLVVLGGGSSERLETALGLYRQGFAPAILLTDADGFFDDQARRLIAAGVPASSVWVPIRPARSTWEDGFSIRQVVLEHHVGSLLVVTSPYHCRRARLILQHETADLGVRITVTPSTSLYMDPAHWWRSRQGWRTVAPEFPKLIWAWLKATTSRSVGAVAPGK